jgi:hypothetical protein
MGVDFQIFKGFTLQTREQSASVRVRSLVKHECSLSEEACSSCFPAKHECSLSEDWPA